MLFLLFRSLHHPPPLETNLATHGDFILPAFLLPIIIDVLPLPLPRKTLPASNISHNEFNKRVSAKNNVEHHVKDQRADETHRFLKVSSMQCAFRPLGANHFFSTA